ncbi:MAG: transglutaminase-like domain-containing protein, partial [Oscillospiraceae bacterium]
MRRKILVCAVLSFCVAAFSSCGNGINDKDGAQASAEVTVNTISEAAETQITEILSETIQSETKTKQTSEIVSETSASAVMTGSETEFTVSSVQNETETSAEISESVTESEIAEIPQTVTTERKTEVVIPEIKVPLASGINVISGENAEVDYSHADDGYISAVYTGKSTAAKLRIKCGELQYDHDLSADGRTEFFPLMGSGSYTVKVYELVSGKSYAEAASGSFEAAIKSDTAMYLYPNKYSSFDSSSDCVKKAAELCEGKNSEMEKIAVIFGYISENITYDKELASTVKSGYVPDPDKTLAKGKGICFD